MLYVQKSAVIARFSSSTFVHVFNQRLYLHHDMSAKRKEAWNYEGHGKKRKKIATNMWRLWITPKIYTSSLNFILFLFSKWISYSEWQVLSWNLWMILSCELTPSLLPLFMSISSQYQQFHHQSFLLTVFIINKL